MAPRTREESVEILKELATLRGQLVEEDDRKVDRIERLIKAAWAIGAVVVVSTAFLLRMQWTINAHDKALEDIGPKVAEMWFMKQRQINNKP